MSDTQEYKIDLTKEYPVCAEDGCGMYHDCCANNQWLRDKATVETQFPSLIAAAKQEVAREIFKDLDDIDFSAADFAAIDNVKAKYLSKDSTQEAKNEI